jgi:IS5 family transposase
MKQLSLAQQAEFPRYTKKTRREQFLEEMNGVMPWAELVALIGPRYSKGAMGQQCRLSGSHLLSCRTTLPYC